MQLVYKYNISRNNLQITEWLKTSKNLYNQANYIVRQEFIRNRKYLNYYDINEIMREVKDLNNEINYRKLKAQTAQQVLRLLDKNWKSFFKSIKKWSKNKQDFTEKPNLPHYLKNEKNIIIFTKQNSKIKDNFIYLDKQTKIGIPDYKGKDFSNYNQIRVLPRKTHNEIEIVYNQEIKNKELNYKKYSSIDIGLKNLVAFVSENNAILINGNILKSYNQFYNKIKSKLISIKDKMKIKQYTKKLYKMEADRENYIKDYLHKTSRFLINYLVKNKIGNLIIGKNKQWKDSINIGKRNNQNFVSIPHSRLIDYLIYKAKLVGINIQLTEESYTSKCDALAFESVRKHETYLGKRIKRGLFQSSVGKLINADINGALNILRKVVNDSFVKKIIDRGQLFRPVKIRNMFSTSLLIFNKNLNYI